MEKILLDELRISSTLNTPEIFFSTQGIISIKGRYSTFKKNNISELVLLWLKEYINNPAEITNVLFAFEYLNKDGTEIMIDIIRVLDKVQLTGKKLKIQWFYEEDDSDIYERGEFIANSLMLPIKFFPIANEYYFKEIIERNYL